MKTLPFSILLNLALCLAFMDAQRVLAASKELPVRAKVINVMHMDSVEQQFKYCAARNLPCKGTCAATSNPAHACEKYGLCCHLITPASGERTDQGGYGHGR